MIEKVKKWWRGEDIFHENKPNDPLIIIGWRNKKHWTSVFVHSILDFYIKHWQWLWGIAVAITVSQPWKW